MGVAMKITRKHWAMAGWGLLAVVTFPVSAIVWLMMNSGDPKHVEIGKGDVDMTLVKSAQKGYMVVTRSDTQLILCRKKRFSFLLALVCLLGCVLSPYLGFGLLVVYVLFYLAEKDDVLTIAVTHDQPAKP
jgi:hypothetical protein